MICYGSELGTFLSFYSFMNKQN
uniref:Uncharacterized protein n=1 Tax=Rhizophora mucronata TaxID=61149 RepID=A0A2P2QV66_RHIMU